MMRKIVILCTLILGFFTVSKNAWAQCNQNCPERRLITVQGMGVVTADADRAVVRVGYKVYGPERRALMQAQRIH
jgi:uncharacterized protein YggE